MTDFLRTSLSKYVSTETARLMALSAYRRAVRTPSPPPPAPLTPLQLRLSPHGTDVAGVALTAALATSTPKRGEHGLCVASHTRRGVTTYSLTFVKGSRSRFQEDRLAGGLLLHALAEACSLPSEWPACGRDELSPDEAVVCDRRDVADATAALLSGAVSVVELYAGSLAALSAARPKVLLPGSFNPLHEGHVGLLRTACELLGEGTVGGFELAVTNADKGTMGRDELERRAAQFTSGAAFGGAAGAPPQFSLVLTDAPLFVQKAELLPDTVFLVGVDTALRIVMPKYYGDSAERMAAVLSQIAGHGCSFLVAGRLMAGVWVEPNAVRPPPGFEGLFRSLPTFRADISSTELREREARR